MSITVRGCDEGGGDGERVRSMIWLMRSVDADVVVRVLCFSLEKL